MCRTQIETTSGNLKGCLDMTNQTVVSFKGVPYARPPVGDLRFRAPVEFHAEKAVRYCGAFMPAPIQQEQRNIKKLPFPVSEDCLYLNIWAPAEEKGNLPVMVWFFGGGFTTGNAGDEEFEGTRMAEKGVILVTVSYRVGVLGFLAYPPLYKDENKALGNYGILDQIQALKWIQKNIGAFGGNPNNITIFGQSAGGISCRILLTSPLAEGLFQRAIIQSGGGLNEADPFRPTEEIAMMTEKALQELGWTAADLEERDAMEINECLQKTVKDILGPGELFFYQPCIDGYCLEDVPGKLIKRGLYHNADIICGTVTGDSWMFSRKLPNEIRADMLSAGGFACSPQLSWAQNEIENKGRKIYTYFFEREIPEAWNPEESSRFAHNGQGPVGKNATPHGSEIVYVFGNLDKTKRKWTPYDRALSETIQNYWCNFARTGNPNGEGLKEWKPYTQGNKKMMHFGNESWKEKQFPENERQQEIVNYTIAHPGMLEKWEGIEDGE